MPPLTFVLLAPDVPNALAAVPSAPGVGQILGPEGKSLLIGRAANLRRWAASHLGAGRPAPRGKRPRTDLRPIATAVAHLVTTSAFGQRLAYERVMARHVGGAARRDLKPPAFLHLDPRERFPRVTVRGLDGGPAGLFGPFRNRPGAERARDALHKLFALRPCDYSFAPDPGLPLGLGCIYAQVRTCAAPCLARVSEEAYRALAGRAVSFLASRPEGFPDWVGPVTGNRGLVVEVGSEGVELYPVREGSVLDDARVTAPEGELAGAAARLRWDGPAPAQDWPWLCAWLNERKRRGVYLIVGGPEALVPDVERALAGMRGR